jgi:hypothetical protein
MVVIGIVMREGGALHGTIDRKRLDTVRSPLTGFSPKNSDKDHLVSGHNG